ncbi:bifunctional YncE family protein/alkaline phosphatase family protein [Ginsengibacter hankyongi]|uniref:Bifunctional YncE family protein/alkaline phosphatase family protein n=1 Tax=Ginsengibacter hankyongi TaxID=2607284 RepID=A0A5J5IPJ8_9BACT|nr:bifunctional YncE family protein/alkaline phosphatase family protein [Ginsengibacter hankyongi]KAA9041442.1 bifunctional YncE family protein/alkaline phosphatase family protein [Ginsengibacter hankyongi]
MRNIAFLLFYFIFFGLIASAQKTQTESKITLPNGWSLSPAGQGFLLGDLPLNIAVSNSKKLMAVTNNGQSTQSIQLIDVPTGKILDNIVVKECWLGLKFSADEKFLYASGGNDNWILKYAIRNNKLLLKDSLKLGNKWPNKISPAGIDIDDKQNLLYVVTKDNNSLYIIDLRTKKIKGQYKLDGEAYTCLLSPDKKELYITCWGCDKLYVFNTASKTFTGSIATGSHPNDICLTKNGKFIFVANANDNSVSIIDLTTKKVIETLTTSLYPNAPQGSTTNGLALSPDEKTLYIANADNNCLAVFDVSEPGESKSEGFIPTGWYPTCVKAIGNKIYVTNGKGFSSFANPEGPNPYKKKETITFRKGDTSKIKTVQYIGGLFIGTMSIIDVPTSKQLGEYSRQVYDNTPYTKEKETVSVGEKGNPIPEKVGEPSPIKYVFYIIKENRTYDQVLGDIKEGNGDSSLVLFGEKVTPNQHKLVNDFVLLDNYYIDAEVSADGHNWSLGGYANDYLEKNWVTSYGGRGGTYDAEGTREIANNKNGFIWNYCKRAGISYRTYGEFADDYKPNIPILKDHFCPYFTSWDLNVRDTTRVGQWKKDFDSLVSVNALPRLNTLRLICDHTEGLRKGRPTPLAHVADNDLAVGMFIDYLSKSPVWKESLVIITEDDAQDGPDHVDAHRSTAYVVSPYVKRHYVDHTPYTTTSLLRTIELVLGLPPMSQYDAAATPLWLSFTATPDLSTFDHVPPQTDINQIYMATNKLTEKTAAFNFSKEDEVNEVDFNEVLWKGIKGMNSPVPSPKRAAFINTNDND